MDQAAEDRVERLAADVEDGVGADPLDRVPDADLVPVDGDRDSRGFIAAADLIR